MAGRPSRRTAGQGRDRSHPGSRAAAVRYSASAGTGAVIWLTLSGMSEYRPGQQADRRVPVPAQRYETV